MENINRDMKAFFIIVMLPLLREKDNPWECVSRWGTGVLSVHQKIVKYKNEHTPNLWTNTILLF